MDEGYSRRGTNPNARPTQPAIFAAVGHHRAGRIDAARDICRDILKDFPDHAPVHNNLGALL
jgi:hypothetical protein